VTVANHRRATSFQTPDHLRNPIKADNQSKEKPVRMPESGCGLAPGGLTWRRRGIGLFVPFVGTILAAIGYYVSLTNCEEAKELRRIAGVMNQVWAPGGYQLREELLQ
jgi:hypothetical protein